MIIIFNFLIKDISHFKLFTVTFNLVDHPKGKLVPAVTYLTAAIKLMSLPASFFLFLEVNNTKKATCYVTKQTNPGKLKALCFSCDINDTDFYK